ncbi:glycoside hydrolase family 43 protein [Actomonas aquatica]|uniref:Glycoside hydrolase family 43 protein n=1 Tax=Actomonas aquatica TaxID=2866162 RepID=A0ABZ1CCY0_9BACT|nr:glycoside hydrolase family 43 protein [Opitutus sp. WL0086]WRQ89533.1 glycoside hydrolase family 43 protein [Opitutus sp. WL0086]
MIKNPILPGFNPDPSIVRVGDDYYIATSTFEWFPGVQIHHSRDLVNWELVARPLDRPSQLDMIGNPDSGGIWAPCLSYSDGLFWLIYTDVKQWTHTRYKVTHNYVVTAPSITGPWSEPTYLDSAGFDASLFHDDDGRKWYLSMIWDHRTGKNQFTGTLLQEFDPQTRTLIGPRKNIFKGTDHEFTEGPHLYKKDGYYYLLVAEGGTWYTHAATIARSRTIDGPYEVDPLKHFLTSKDDESATLQKAGHASLVQTKSGAWYVVHLTGRPLRDKRCTLGRETAIQRCSWEPEGWPRLSHGGCVPTVDVEDDGLPLTSPTPPSRSHREEFDTADLSIHFQALRRPITKDWLELTARPGWVRLHGEEPTTSNFRQALIARRQQAFDVEVTTRVDFDPVDFKHMAGLIAYYDTTNHYYLRITRDEELGRCLGIIRTDAGDTGELPDVETALPDAGPVHLRVTIHREALQFSYSLDGSTWIAIGPELDATILSDDYHSLGFTGAFIGLSAQDLNGHGHPADFDYFDYQELSE